MTGHSHKYYSFIFFTTLIFISLSFVQVNANEMSIEKRRQLLLEEYKGKKEALDKELKSQLIKLKMISDKSAVKKKRKALHRDINLQKKKLTRELREKSQALYSEEMALKGHSVSFDKTEKVGDSLTLKERIELQDSLNVQLSERQNRYRHPNLKNRKMTKLVTIYVKKDCLDCEELKKFLRNQHIRYQIFDVGKSDTSYKEYRRLGGKGYPLVKIGKARMNGFDKYWILQQLQ